MKPIRNLFALASIIILLIFPGVSSASNEDYPGVWQSDGGLIFVSSSDDQAALHGVTVLTYEYSMDWIITAANLGVKTEDGILLTDGHQYAYNVDGTMRSESEFSSLQMNLAWADYTFQMLPSYGYYLAPMVKGGMAYALVEIRSGLPSQLALAMEAFEHGSTLNLYEGFLYQISEGEMSAQVAFTEVAFGSRGLVRGKFPDNFPPPPENYPNPYPQYPSPNFPPPVGNTNNTGNTGQENPSPTGESASNPDSGLPQGTPVPEDQRIETPRFTFEPSHNYDVPQIKRIGVVGVRSSATIDGYEAVCDQDIQEALGKIEGVELVYLPFDDAIFGGAVMYDRAVYLCEQYGVDSLLLCELDELNIPGAELAGRYSKSTSVQVNLDAMLVESTGGSTVWEKELDRNELRDNYEIENNKDGVLKSELKQAVNGLIDDLISQGALNARHVD